MTSPDGTTWTLRTSAADITWTSVTYGNGLFVAVAQNGTGNNGVMTSPDGITWASRTSAADDQWNGITYGDGIFVSVSLTGTNRVMTSGVIGLAARTTAAANAEAARAAEAARVAAANAEAARVAAVAAETARKAKEQRELTEILSIIPELGKLSLNIGETTKSLTGQKCVKGKATKFVYKGAKCPKGFARAR
jgi:nucleoid-associated protein YgaU